MAAYYIPLVGYAIFFGVILVRTREFLVRSRSLVPVLTSQIVLFTLIFSLNWRWQIRNQRRFPDYWRDLALMNATAADFRSHPAWFRPGSLILIVSDPFPENEWATAFIALLIANDKSLVVHRLGKINPPPTPADIARYATVIGYQDGRYVELPGFRLP